MKYQVLDNGKWITCLRATVTSAGWLHYELRDGTNALLGPSKRGIEWREKPAKGGQ